MQEQIQLARVSVPDDPSIVLPVLLAVGFGLLGFALVLWTRIRRARSWRLAMGRIEHAGLEWDTDDGSEAQPVLEVRYAFEVAGRQFRGNRPLLAGTWWLTRRRTHRLAERLSRTNRVTVYFDPDNPNRNCLDRDGHGVAGWVTVTGLAFLLIAFLEYGL